MNTKKIDWRDWCCTAALVCYGMGYMTVVVAIVASFIAGCMGSGK